MFKDSEHWCKTFVDCSMRKTPRTAGKVPLIPVPVQSGFDRVVINVLGPFPLSSSGNRYIVVFSDCLTR